jgi:hypothetical protein
VDIELSQQERYSIEVHLKDCQTCRFIYEQERELKKAIRAAVASVTAPAELREKILSDCRVITEGGNVGGRWQRLLRPLQTGLRPAFVSVTIFLLVVAGLYLMWPVEKPIALAALQTHESIVVGAISLAKSGDPREVKKFLFRSVGGTFAPMEYDFSVAGLRAVAGLVQEIGGRKALVTVYEGKGSPVICLTFMGSERDAPADATVFFDAGKERNFYTFSQGGTNAVFQRVGERVCILVSEMPPQDLLTLARSRVQPASLKLQQ